MTEVQFSISSQNFIKENLIAEAGNHKELETKTHKCTALIHSQERSRKNLQSENKERVAEETGGTYQNSLKKALKMKNCRIFTSVLLQMRLALMKLCSASQRREVCKDRDSSSKVQSSQWNQIQKQKR